MFESAAIHGHNVVFRINTLDLKGIIEILVGTETIVNGNGYSKFLLGDAVDSFCPSFAIQYRSTGYEPFSFDSN